MGMSNRYGGMVMTDSTANDMYYVCQGIFWEVSSKEHGH